MASAESAKRILEEKRGTLTKAQIHYLHHVIEEGERAKKYLEQIRRERSQG